MDHQDVFGVRLGHASNERRTRIEPQIRPGDPKGGLPTWRGPSEVSPGKGIRYDTKIDHRIDRRGHRVELQNAQSLGCITVL